MGVIHKNQSKLAKALGFSTQALNKWRVNFDDSVPVTLDVSDWRTFIKESGCGFYREGKDPDNRGECYYQLESTEDHASALVIEMAKRCEQSHAALVKWKAKVDMLIQEAREIIDAS